MKTGYQGNHGTFSEIAALQYFKDKTVDMQGYHNFKEIMSDTEKGILDYGVLPVENTTTGIIARSYDLFKYYDVHAVGEINVPIREDLLVNHGTKIEDIREVYSHPEALSQCQEFFDKHPWMKPVAGQDTAKSAEYVKESGSNSIAALGSWRAGEYYHLEPLLKNVQDSETNMTRFLVVSHQNYVSDDADKISMMLVLKHHPGSLYNILGILSKNGINIVRLESRPIPGKVFQYMFYIDFEGNTKSREMQAVLKELSMRCEESRVFGCYKSASH